MDTVILFLVFCLLILFIRSYAKDSIIKLAAYSFVLYWYGALIASTFSPYGLLEVSTRTYLLLVLGTVSFILGLLFFSPPNNLFRGFDKSSVCQAIEKMLTSKILYVLYLIAIIYYAKFAITAIAYAAISGNVQTEDQLELIFMGNSKAQIIHGYVITPMLHIALVLLSYAFLNLKGNFRRFTFAIFILLAFFIEYLLILGGRSTIIIAALYFILSYFVLKYNAGSINISFKKVFVVVAILGVITTVYTYSNIYRTTGTFDISMKEESEDKSAGGLFETVSRYSLCPIVLFDRSMENNYLDRFGYQYGRATFMGFDTWINIGLRFFGIQHKTASHITEYLEDNYFPYDKSGTTANYAYTGLFYHYIDYGILGIIIFPFLFGFLFNRIVLLLYRRPSIFSFLLLGIGYFMLLHSLFTCYFIKGWVALYISVLGFCIYLKKSKKSYFKSDR